MATIVNTSALFTHANVATSGAQAIGFTPTSGNRLIVAVSAYTAAADGSGLTVSDSAGNTYNPDGYANTLNSLVTDGIVGAVFSTVVGSVPTTITITPGSGGPNWIAWAVIEVSGTAALDRAGTSTSTSTSSDASVTASAANTTTTGIAVAVAAVPNDDTDVNLGDTPPSGYTNIRVQEDSNAVVGFSMVRKIYSGSETSSAAWTHDNTSQTGWAAAIATYKDSGGGGGDLSVNTIGEPVIGGDTF